MKDLVFHHRTTVVASITSVVVLLWGLLAVPGGAPWTGLVWLGALGLLLVTSATLLFGLARSPSMAQVLRGVEAEPKPAPALRPRPR